MSGEFTINDISAELRQAMKNFGSPIAAAATEAVNIAGSVAHDLGQQNIAAAGFGVRWQNTWKVRYYQVGQIDAAAWLWHKIPYAEIFEDGGTIVGRPFLWIPLRNAPKTFGVGGKRFSPKSLKARGIKLFSIERAGKPPLLATKIFTTRAQAKKTNFRVTGKTLLASRTLPKNPARGLVRMTVPLFFGVRKVVEKKRFQIREIARSQVDALNGYYDAALNALVD